MFCENCGKQIPDGSAFCPECGANLTRYNPDEESTVLLTSDYSSTYSSDPYQPQGYDYYRDPYNSSTPSGKDGGKRVILIIALILAIIALTVAGIFVVKKLTSSDQEDKKTEEVEKKSKDKKEDEKSEEAEETADDIAPAAEEPAQEPAEAIPEEPVRAAAPQVNMNTVSATASDHYNEIQLKNPIDHLPSLVIDGNATTAWAVQNSRAGVGDYITLNLGGTYTVSGFDIYAGHHKSQELFYKNCRPSKMTVTFSDGTSYSFVIGDAMTVHRETLSKPVEANSVTFSIDDAYIGSKYPNDMCISEISLF